MQIEDALKSAISALKRMHVLGDEADKMARIINVLQSVVDAAESVRREEGKNANRNEQREDV